MRRRRICCLSAGVVLGLVSTAGAQATTPPEHRFSADIGIGWDNSISGNINSSGIGAIQGQTVVILKNKYEDVYGTGLHLRVGVGYMLDESSEARLTFIFQSLDAELTRLGDLGISNLYGQYNDYQSWGLDFGYRRYMVLSDKSRIRGYGEAAIGLAFIDETNVNLVAPSANFNNTARMYNGTTAFSLSFNVGALFPVTARADAFAQFGLRYLTGLNEAEVLFGTGLESINDKSARWAIPFSAGVRYRF